MFDCPRRNSGRLLVAAIESSHGVDLDGLLARTSELMVRAGVVSRRPAFVRAATFEVSGEVLLSGGGEWLTFHEFDEFDLLVGVASRTRVNAGVRAENRAIGVLIDVLRTRSPEGVLYGTLLSVRSDRLARTREGEAARTSVLKEWDIRRIDETGVNDPVGNPGFDVIEMMAGYQSELEVTHIRSKTTAERQSAFERGVSKYARKSTHAVVRVHPVSGVMSWDLEVVAALREAAGLLVAGASWAVAAEAVGSRIPAYGLVDESDRLRAAKNDRRRQLGRPVVPLRWEEDGRPNPAYRPESIADALYPHLALRNVLHREAASQERRDATEAFLEADLGGVDDRESRRRLLVDGVYVRRGVDLFKSNKTRKRFRVISFDLGPVDGLGGVLSAAQFDAVWPPIDADRFARNGRTGYGYFKGLFEVVAPDRVYSHGGWLDRSAGVWRFRVRSDPRCGRRPSYGVQFEPLSENSGVGYVTMGLVGMDVLHGSVRDAIVELLDAPGVLPADVTWVVRARDRAGDLSMLRGRVERTRLEYQRALSKGLEVGLSPEAEEGYGALAAEKEVELRELRSELERREAAAADTTVSGVWPLGRTVDVLAVLGSTRKYDKYATRAIQAAVQEVVRGATIRVDTDGMVRWSAVFTLVNADGVVVEHPISGEVPNEASDIWVRPTWEAKWWAAATGQGDVGFAAGSTVVTRGGGRTDFVRRVAARIEEVAEVAGVKLRTNAAKAIAMCPDWDAARVAMRLVSGEVVESRLGAVLRHALLVDDTGVSGPFDATPRSFYAVWPRVLCGAAES